MRSAITQIEIATAIKELGPSTIDEVSRHVDASYESSRAQIAQMADEGLLAATADRTATTGRPPSRWSLTPAGEHLFPKNYAALASLILSELATEAGGPEGLEAALARMVDRRVEAWRPLLERADLESRLDALRAVYSDDDPFISVERGDDGRLRLVERNCPFLDVALAHPELCGVTVNTISRILGRRVVREERFQSGDGRCVFLVTNAPAEHSDYVPET